MKYCIASDHAGFNLKNHIVQYLESKNIEIEDFGSYSLDRVDYPDYAVKVCQAINTGEFTYGILVCGSGIGMSIAANKFKGIRASLARDYYDSYMAKAHNRANVLCLGERTTGVGTAESIIDAWLTTDFEGGRHTDRVEKIKGLE
jgi:ribose 5-phosphate isomerase B